MNEKIAVLDIETTWYDDVMSIGIVIGDMNTFDYNDSRYFLIEPFIDHKAKYHDEIYLEGIVPDLTDTRENVIREIIDYLKSREVTMVFAYNASFDLAHLPELSHFEWYDIMAIAANKNHNSKIPHYYETYSTGRLKRRYSAEDIYRLLSGDKQYKESHNALLDTVDELKMMRMLGIKATDYKKCSYTKES
ncbi:MAG: hypothetical protein FWG21_01150 [Oscillospiraceae bacterium]|nr:hypothetical protein [Oscillospiraceae bacterium]